MASKACSPDLVERVLLWNGKWPQDAIQTDRPIDLRRSAVRVLHLRKSSGGMALFDEHTWLSELSQQPGCEQADRPGANDQDICLVLVLWRLHICVV